MNPTWPRIPSDEALSRSLKEAFPSGARLLQATPEREGHLTIRLETAPRSTVEGLLFSEDSAAYRAARDAYGTPGASEIVDVDIDIDIDEACRLVIPRSGEDRALPALAGLLEEGTPWRLVRHRLERRAVLRHDEDGVHGKLFKSAKRAERAARTLALANAAGLSAPAVRGVDRERPLLTVETLPGSSLLDVLSRAADGLPASAAAAASACRAAGAALARLARAPIGTSIGERHSLRDELAVVDRWTDPLAALAPSVHDAGRRLRRMLGEAGERLDANGLVPSHRDYYDKQLLVADDSSVAIVDWDSLTLADPALDAGNFVAHLRLRALQGLLSATTGEALRRAFLDGRGPLPSPASLAFFESASLLRLAAIYALRPPHAPIVPSILAAAEEAIR